MPLKVLKIGTCAVYGHIAHRQNCINHSDTQHSATRCASCKERPNIIQTDRKNKIWEIKE